MHPQKLLIYIPDGRLTVPRGVPLPQECWNLGCVCILRNKWSFLLLPPWKLYLPWCLPSPPALAVPFSWGWRCSRWGSWRRQPSPGQCRIHNCFPAELSRSCLKSHSPGWSQLGQHCWSLGTQPGGKGTKGWSGTLGDRTANYWHDYQQCPSSPRLIHVSPYTATHAVTPTTPKAQDTSLLTLGNEMAGCVWQIYGLQFKLLFDTE